MIARLGVCLLAGSTVSMSAENFFSGYAEPELRVFWALNAHLEVVWRPLGAA